MPSFAELRLIRLFILVLGAVCVVYAGSNLLHAGSGTKTAQSANGEGPAMAAAMPTTGNGPGGGLPSAPTVHGVPSIMTNKPRG